MTPEPMKIKILGIKRNTGCGDVVAVCIDGTVIHVPRPEENGKFPSAEKIVAEAKRLYFQSEEM